MITQHIKEAFPSAVCQPAMAQRVRVSSKLPQVDVIFNITETNHINAWQGELLRLPQGACPSQTVQQTAGWILLSRALWPLTEGNTSHCWGSGHPSCNSY